MFRVRWQKSALDELTDLWMRSSAALRQTITAAQHNLDAKLGTDPLKDSESRDKGRRVRFVPPLGVQFRIEKDGLTVSVLRAWLFRRHGQ